MIADHEIDRAKASVSPLELAMNYGLEPRRQGSDRIALCPFHAEKTPSFVIHTEDVPGRPPYHCFGCGWSGDAIAFVQAVEGLDFREACERLGGAEDESPTTPEQRRQWVEDRRQRQSELEERERLKKAKKREQWPTFRIGKDATLSELANLRGVSFTAVKLAQLSGCLRFCLWRGHRAWIIGDSTRICAQARRLDGELWEDTKPEPFKAWTLPGSELRPVGLTRHPLAVLIVEGGPDLLAAWHWLHIGRQCSQFQPAAMLGANAKLGPYASWLAARHVWIARHGDQAGEDAAQYWANEAHKAGATKIEIINLPSDLNDLIHE